MRPHSLANYADYATGAVHHPADARDYGMHRLPAVAAALGQAPATADLSSYVHSIYNQGQVPACVCYSIALMKSVEAAIDRRAWSEYDALEAYHALGGNDRDGVPTRGALQFVQDTGLELLGQTARHRIGSYAFAPQEPEPFVSTLKAALWANRPCVLACRLPETFGWDSQGPPTPAYHQMALLGYGADQWIIGNSWGSAWGRNGFGRIPIQFTLDNSFQGGDCYAYTAVDYIDPGLAPAAGDRTEPGGSSASRPLLVGGYLGASVTMAEATEGSLLRIVGDGFEIGQVTATWNGYILPVESRQARVLEVRIPKQGLGGRLGPVTVRREGEVAEGPLLYVRPVSAAG